MIVFRHATALESFKTNVMFSASAQKAALTKRKRRGAGARALLRGVWGLNKLPTCHLIGRPTNKSELKIRVRQDCKWKKFWTTKIFSAYNHNNIPHEVTHGDIFVLQLVPCGGRDICTSRKSSPPHLFRLERRALRRLKRINVSTTNFAIS